MKFGGSYYSAAQLSEIVGELVYASMGEYWQSYVRIYRGAVGCQGWFCNAEVELPKG